MKHGKKLVSLLLALVMVMGLAVTAMADETTKTGSITISNPVDGESYDIYKMFDLESYNTSGDHAYKITNDWKDFVTTGAGKDYFQLDGEYVTVKKDVTIADNSDTAAKLAKDALAYAKEKGLSPLATLDKNNSFTKTGLALGYYLVDSSLGTLCSLDTTNPSVEMQEKNEAPTVVKEVKDKVNGWGESNTASIGDTVKFKTTIHAKEGAQKYVLHDKMSAGLTLNKDSITVAGATKGNDYTVAYDVTHQEDEKTITCDFEITFTQAYLDEITADTDIVVTYSAVLNEGAVIADNGNTNDTKLNYGDKSETEWDQTKTYTFKFDLVKTKEDNTILAGAKFELYDAETDGNKIALVKESDGTYRVATATEKSAEGFTSAVIEAGHVTIKGLGNGTYYLEETEAPAGYNKLSARVAVIIKDGNEDATVTENKWTAGGVKVINKTGTELPSTGGIGTTIFYVIGGILVLGAAVLLVTRKRMDA